MNGLCKTTPTRELAPVARLFDRLWNDSFFGVPSLGEIIAVDEGTLAVDVSEDDRHVIVRASLPGFKKEDVDIEVHDGVLSIKAAHSEEHEEKNERFYRKERRFGSVSRRIALPSAVLEGEAKADLSDGVLTLRLPKSPKDLPKKVRIG